MKLEQEQECPLCSSPASFYWVDYSNRKFFKCPKCTYYQISKAAEKRIIDSPQQWRDEYSKHASSAPEGFRLVIIVPSIPPGAGTQVALSGDYVAIDDLP
ncbi:MAG: hypothetical protein J0I77_17730 [Rudaea sp.]|uniref:hypothetical protein n=1 Tax=unclassified Rudaea TaxID=2627037 RepID=UPI0010F9D4F6|nr:MULTISPECIES: hypothetical protein [unclassified Rudaea]MBN8887569.1 hypothetical protein [Rudaea sp.]